MKSKLALSIALLCLAPALQAQQAPNPLDAIPEKMPFDVPYGTPITLDRATAAIAAAVAEAAPGDTVLIAGKGHETGQEIAGTVYPFDDRIVVRRAIEETR